MRHNYIDIFIKNKCNEIPVNNNEYINKFLPFYTDISNDDLTYLFAYYHHRLNHSFRSDRLSEKDDENQIVQLHGGQIEHVIFQIPWRHNIEILNKTKIVESNKNV